jgi:hypothetical protein
MSIQEPAHLSKEIWIGNKANVIFSTATLNGVVLASVRGAIYLKTTDQEIIWMAERKTPMHARCIRLEGELPSVSVNTAFTYLDRKLIFSPGMTVELDKRHHWRLLPPRPAAVVTSAKILSLRDQLVSELLTMPELPGFGSLIRNLHIPLTPEPVQPVLKKALPILRSIKNVCELHDLSGILNTAHELIGLGDGLTPSGDDFLGGLLCTFSVFHPLFTHYKSINHITIELFLEKIRSLTNEISWTLLLDNAHGSAIEPASHLLHQILRGQSLSDLNKTVQELSIIGHSTGWDLLTGILLGLCWLQTN